MKDLLLVIDMQNVYREGAPWECRETGRTISNIRTVLDSGAAGQVILTQYIAPERPAGTWKAYNEAYRQINENLWMNSMMEELLPYTRQFPLYAKSTYSACSIEGVVKAALGSDRVIVTGVVAECCVLATVEGLIDLGVKVIYLKDAISGQNEEMEGITEKIVESFSDIHTGIMTTEQYLKQALAQRLQEKA